MVKEEKFADGGVERKGYDAAQRAMSPADLLQVFVICILRVDDQDIGAAKELDQLRAGGHSVSAGFVQVGFLALGQSDFQNLIGLVIGQVGDRPMGSKKPVTDTDTRMIHKASLHPHLSDREIHFL